MTACPKIPDRAPYEQSQVHERLDESTDDKLSVCTGAAPTITGTSTCFVLSEHSSPAAPAWKMPAYGGRVGVKFSQGGSRRGG